MQKSLVILLLGTALLSNGTVFAEQGPLLHKSSPQKGSAVKGQESADLSLQQERLELEKQKSLLDVEIENKKLGIERDKLRIEEASSKWSALSAAGPLTIALGTLAFSIWSFRKQGRQQADMQLEAARLQFEIKAAEIAFSGRTPKAVANRAKVLKAFFPNRLPDDFTQRFSPTTSAVKSLPRRRNSSWSYCSSIPEKRPKSSISGRSFFPETKTGCFELRPCRNRRRPHPKHRQAP